MRSTEYFELFRGVFACNLTLLINKKKYSTFHFNIAYGSAELCRVPSYDLDTPSDALDNQIGPSVWQL